MIAIGGHMYEGGMLMRIQDLNKSVTNLGFVEVRHFLKLLFTFIHYILLKTPFANTSVHAFRLR